MNDRAAEKLFIMNAVQDFEGLPDVRVEAVSETSDHGTEAYYFHLVLEYRQIVEGVGVEKHTLTADSYNFSEAVDTLYQAAVKLKIIDHDFMAG